MGRVGAPSAAVAGSGCGAVPGGGRAWAGRGDFDVHLCVIFDPWCQGFISGRETGWWPLSPLIFDILSNIY